MDNDTTNDSRSIFSLIRDLRDDMGTLVRQEVALAKKETSEKVRRLGKNAGVLIAGGLIAYTGVILILAAVSILLFYGLERAGVAAETALWLAPALLGLLIVIVGAVMAKMAINALSRESIAPERTLQSLKEDKKWGQKKAA